MRTWEVKERSENWKKGGGVRERGRSESAERGGGVRKSGERGE